MKKETLYGIFTKGRGGKFIGPRFDAPFTAKDIYFEGFSNLESYRKEIAKISKRKVVIKKLVWKNI